VKFCVKILNNFPVIFMGKAMQNFIVINSGVKQQAFYRAKKCVPVRNRNVQLKQV